jgi:hypothetical protein
MITTAKQLHGGILRGYQRQGSIEISAPCALYAVDFWRTEEKIRSELLPPAAADCAVGVRLMETRSRNEDDKPSTEPGQLQNETTKLKVLSWKAKSLVLKDKRQ